MLEKNPYGKIWLVRRIMLNNYRPRNATKLKGKVFSEEKLEALSSIDEGFWD